MAKHSTLNDLFTGIANAIRSKTGSTAPIVADDFPDAIAGISGGGSSGGSDTRAVCYVYDSAKEYESSSGTMLGSIIKLSDDVINPNDYTGGVVILAGLGLEVDGMEIPYGGMDAVIDPGQDGLAVLNALDTTSLLFVSQLSDMTDQANIPSTGIWLIKRCLGVSDKAYFILNKK